MIRNWFKAAEPAKIAAPDPALEDQLAALNRQLEQFENLETELAQYQSLLDLYPLKLAIPPAHMQVRVGGVYNKNFFRLGADLARRVGLMLGLAGKTFEQFESILDFGCGCGRVMIPLSTRLSHPERLFGADIDPEAITWCQQNLPWAGGFVLNPHAPPSPFEDGKFDLIYGISVFTHLPEDLQHAWLQELSRISRSGALLVLTFHGATLQENLPDALAENLKTHGFAHSGATTGTTDGLPDFYQTSFHTTAYVQKTWGAYFEVVGIREQMMGIQDAVLLRKA